MGNKFEAMYQVQDGFVGKDRPRTFNIDHSDIEEGASIEELKDLYYDMVQNDFEQNISPGAERMDEFLAWAEKVISERTANKL